MQQNILSKTNNYRLHIRGDQYIKPCTIEEQHFMLMGYVHVIRLSWNIWEIALHAMTCLYFMTELVTFIA